MTDHPSPSDRSERIKSAPAKRPWVALTMLFLPFLFASGTIALALGAVVALHQFPPAPKSLTTAVVVALPEPETEPPPISAADFEGFNFKPQTDQARIAPPSEPEPPPPDRYELTLRLEKGDTVEKMLADIDVSEADRKQIDEKLSSILKKRKLSTGETITLTIQNLPDQTDTARVLSLSVRPQPEHEFIVTRRDDGSYDAEEKTYKVTARIVRVEAERHGSLQASGIAAGAPSQAIVEFIRALAYDVDFQRELKEGQKFTVLLEQLVTSDGKITHPGRLLAGEIHLFKRSVTVIRFKPQGGAEQFYNTKGESVVRSFLRTPMDASKVTSRYGMRDHPILGYSAMHTGVDFAAQPGTPILAAGAGRVTMAGFNGGYGLYVRLEHTREIGTGYAHMSRLGPGIKPGVAVRQGQVIGFVGSTGMSTGPHLHYEFYRAGHAVNPLAQKFAMQAALGGKDLPRFQGLARQYLAQFKNAPQLADTKPKPRPDDSQVARGGD